jgi:type IV pilus assembly protein PilC
MRRFSYTALDARGKESKGSLEATDSAEALRRIKEMGRFPTKVAPLPDRSESRKCPSRPGHGPPPRALRGGIHPGQLLPWRRGRVRPKVLTLFTRQLSTLLDAGMPLLRGLRILEEQEPSPVMKRVVRDLSEAIEGGGTLSEGLASCPRVFGPLYVSMAKAGEAGGVLDVVLDRLASFLEKAERIKGKVIAAMFYPAAVLTVAMGIMAFLMAFVIPKFQAVFLDMMGNRPLPVFTVFVLGLSAALKNHFFALLAAGAGLATGARVFASTQFGRRALDHLKLHLPVLGPVLCKAAISRFCRTLGTLVSSGVPILQALTIVQETAGNVVLGEAVGQVHQSVKEGETITVPLRASGVFPAIVVGMVDIGEQTGALPDMLMKIADNYDEEVDNAVAALTSLLEPVMIVILAVLVGSIVIAMFLPILALIGTGFDSDPGGADDRG